MDGKRMHAAREFRCERGIYHAMAIDAALPPEGLSHNIYAVVSFPPGPVAGMAPVLVGFINHVQIFGRESLGQLSRDTIFGLHAPALGSAFCECQDLKLAAACPHSHRL
jgi:hypothetical protein